MPREVFAEEIEQFLATVEGVGAARVLTTPEGEVAQIHVTAETTAESGAIRRAVVSALATEYGLPVEPGRIHVAQLRGSLRPAEIPQFRLAHVEETVSATETVAAVQIAWMEGGAKRTAVGRARGPTPHRMRTLATATIEAARSILESPQRRLTLQQVSLTTFLEQPAALVGISVSTSRGPEILIGAALRSEVQDAVILAALDAVTKWLLRTATPLSEAQRPGDRRSQLDAMRHFIRTTERPGPRAADIPAPPEATSEETAPASPPPARAAPEMPVGGVSPRARTPAAVPPPSAGQRDVPPLAPRPGPDSAEAERVVGLVQEVVSVTRRLYGGVAPPEGEIAEDQDVLEDLSEIRPEEKGGREMAVHQDSPRQGVVPPRAARPSMEDTFYQGLVEEQTPVHLRCRDGYEIPHAVLRDVGTYTLLVEARGGTELVYKHAIISIRLLPTPEA
jgi:sRNA-binding regulator protein Hfq